MSPFADPVSFLMYGLDEAMKIDELKLMFCV